MGAKYSGTSLGRLAFWMIASDEKMQLRALYQNPGADSSHEEAC